jgi:hypothetical protein
MPKPKLKIPQKSLEAFCQSYQIQRMALFGSVLREDFNPNSDVDILVTFAPDAQIGFMALGKMKRELSALFQRPVDLVPQEGLKPIIRDEVLSSTLEIYAA